MSEETNGWTETPPTEMGDYWFWDGDEDHRPISVSVDRVPGLPGLFEPEIVAWSAGDEDMKPIADHADGWWLRLPLPEPPPGKEVNWRVETTRNPSRVERAAAELMRIFREGVAPAEVSDAQREEWTIDIATGDDESAGLVSGALTELQHALVEAGLLEKHHRNGEEGAL